MKIDVRSSGCMYIENGDYTYYIDFSIEGETILHRYLTESDCEDDNVGPMIIWTDGSNAIEIL